MIVTPVGRLKRSASYDKLVQSVKLLLGSCQVLINGIIGKWEFDPARPPKATFR